MTTISNAAMRPASQARRPGCDPHPRLINRYLYSFRAVSVNQIQML
jgi:hypothetical protein